MDHERKRPRWVWFLVGAIALVGVGAAGTWAAITVLQPAEDPLEVSDHTLVEVVQGEVGSALTLNSIAEWKPTPVGVNQAVGVVTEILISPGDEVLTGKPLYSVDLRPVVVAQGEVPSFRQIGKGVEGKDVVQLQIMLADLGFYNGPTDGKAGDRTVHAIDAWQKHFGLSQTGVVERGDIVYVPSLPMRVSLDGEDGTAARIGDI